MNAHWKLAKAKHVFDLKYVFFINFERSYMIGKKLVFQICLEKAL